MTNTTHCRNGHEYADRLPLKFKKDGSKVCKECIAINSQKYRDRHPENYNRMQHLKRNYGMTIQQYEDMAADGCHLCGAVAKNVSLCVDHDHVTGLVRGILCHNCNSGLHTVERFGIDAVAAYLIS